MNFLYVKTDRQTDTTEILYMLHSWSVKNLRPLTFAALCGRIARIGLRSSLATSDDGKVRLVRFLCKTRYIRILGLSFSFNDHLRARYAV